MRRMELLMRRDIKTHQWYTKHQFCSLGCNRQLACRFSQANLPKMAKKRGGKNRKTKSSAAAVAASGDETEISQSKIPSGGDPSASSTEAVVNRQYSDSDRCDDRYRAIAEYVQSVKPLLDSMTRALHIPNKNTESFVGAERNLLIRQIGKEFKGRVSLYEV